MGMTMLMAAFGEGCEGRGGVWSMVMYIGGIKNSSGDGDQILEYVQRRVLWALSWVLGDTYKTCWCELGYLLDTEVTNELLWGKMDIPDDVYGTTTLVLNKICCLGMDLENEKEDRFSITPARLK